MVMTVAQDGRWILASLQDAVKGGRGSVNLTLGFHSLGSFHPGLISFEPPTRRQAMRLVLWHRDNSGMPVGARRGLLGRLHVMGPANGGDSR